MVKRFYMSLISAFMFICVTSLASYSATPVSKKKVSVAKQHIKSISAVEASKLKYDLVQLG